jgi:hypothetical protein
MANAKPAKAPKPDIKSPPLTALVNEPPYNRYVYIPGEGMYAGDQHGWLNNHADETCWKTLRRLPKLGQWLTEHPLAVVYGRTVEDTNLFYILAIFASGEFLKEKLAKGMTPAFTWAPEEAPVASAALSGVEGPVEMGLEADPSAELYTQSV